VKRRDRVASYLVAFLATSAGVLALGSPGGAATGLAAAAGPASTTATLIGRGSVDEAWLTGANPGDQITLTQHGSAVAVTGNPGTADSLGSLIIRNLTPGTGYAWKDTTTNQRTTLFRVLEPGRNPAVDATLYTGQAMNKGLNYITMRDGIQLAATVRFPSGKICTTASPCPTVIEYSGYATAAPTDPIPFYISQALGKPCTNCGDPNLLPDSATAVGSVLVRTVGFATVSLQMRGTGCSGGAFDLFGYPSDYDAYDAIEIVAHQSWVAHHKVGMVGISYSGLSQFPSAGTDPPDLAAIAPMSPTDDLFSTGYPGGIYNNGFAANWIASRIDDAMAAASYGAGHLIPLATTPVTNVGQPWTYYEIDDELAASGGASSPCLANQALHNQAQGLASLVGPQIVAPGTGPGRDPSLFDRRSMSTWAASVKVPVFLSGALQDEQTGPQWAALIRAIPAKTPLFANMVNGNHIDSADPQTITRWLEFLDLYVADAVPTQPNSVGVAFLTRFASVASGISTVAPLPPIRFTTAPDLATAQADFTAATPLVQVLFDNGAGSIGPGDIESTYSAGFSSWPPAGQVTKLYFGLLGALQATDPAVHRSNVFTLDPATRPATSLPPGGNPWAANPGWDWTPVPSADGLAFQTAPFQSAVTIVGPATLDLWVRSATPVEDYQATITEVQPSTGQEEYVTSGFLRSSNQVDNPDSTKLFTDPTYLGADAVNLSPTSYSLVKIPIDPIAHTFRPGTELRVVISAPGGDRPVWTFDTLDAGQQSTVGLGGATPSGLVVNEVSGVSATAVVPVCNSLRGEPCRAYQAEGNQTSATG
jgi:predicted acyl esterase